MLIMSSPEDKQRHRRRLQNRKKKDKKKIPSPIAKSLEEPMYHQRVIRDKRGKSHDLEKMSFLDLVKEIQEDK